MNIHHLREELQSLLSLSEEVGAEAIRDTISGMSGEINSVIEDVAKYIRNLELLETSAKEEADRIKARAERFKASAATAREEIKKVMEMAGVKKSSGALFTVTLAKGSDRVEVFDESLIPDEFVSVSVVQKADKNAIKAALKSGQDMPGAKIVTGEKVLRIK